MPVRIALIVSAPLELTLTAGQVELAPQPQAAPPDEAPFLNVGRHAGDEVHVSGPLIGDPDLVGASLSVAWYFPDEESPDLARTVDLGEARVFVGILPRRRAEPGWRWHHLLETRRAYREVHYFGSGFQPPFKASDIVIRIDSLINYNYDGHVMSRLEWGGRPASQVEGEWRFPSVESEGFLED